MAAIAPSAADRFIEIGPGPGALTTRLAARAAHVTAIEVDRDLAADLARIAPPNLEIVTADILDVDLAGFTTAGAVRVAGNLPYNISSPILFRLLDLESRRPVHDATLMLQREVADRIIAKPGIPHARTLICELISWLRARNIEPRCDRQSAE